MNTGTTNIPIPYNAYTHWRRSTSKKTILLYIDLFCGAGGTSTGVNSARLNGEQCAEVMRQAELSTKGLTAIPECEISDGANKSLQVYNTNGREVLIVYFDRIYDKGEGPQVKRL